MNEHAIDRIRRNLSDKYNSWNKTIKTKQELEKNKKYKELKGIVLDQKQQLKEIITDLASIIRLFQIIKGKDYEKIFLRNTLEIIAEYSDLLDKETNNLDLKSYQEYEKNIDSEKNINTKLSMQADVFLGKHTSTTETFGNTVTRMATGLAFVLVVCFSTLGANASELSGDNTFGKSAKPLTEQVGTSINKEIENIQNQNSARAVMDSLKTNVSIQVNFKWETELKDTLHITKSDFEHAVTHSINLAMSEYSKINKSVDSIEVVVRDLGGTAAAFEMNTDILRVKHKLHRILIDSKLISSMDNDAEYIEVCGMLWHELAHMIFFENHPDYGNALIIIDDGITGNFKGKTFTDFENALLRIKDLDKETELYAFNESKKFVNNMTRIYFERRKSYEKAGGELFQKYNKLINYLFNLREFYDLLIVDVSNGYYGDINQWVQTQRDTITMNWNNQKITSKVNKL